MAKNSTLGKRKKEALETKKIVNFISVYVHSIIDYTKTRRDTTLNFSLYVDFDKLKQNLIILIFFVTEVFQGQGQEV